jgi:hypothetical protein
VADLPGCSLSRSAISPSAGGEKTQAMLSGWKSGSAAALSACIVCEQLVVFDGVVDRRGGEDGVEAAAAGGGIVLGEDGLDDGLLRDRLAGLRRVGPLGLEVVDVETEDVPVLDRVGDGVGVELLLEEVRRGRASRPARPRSSGDVALASKMGVPVKPKSCALGRTP